MPSHIVNPRAIVLCSLKYDGALNYTWPATLLWEDAGGFVWSTPAGAPFTRPRGIEPVPFDWIGRVWYDRWYLVDASLVPALAPKHRSGTDAAPTSTVDHFYGNIAKPGIWHGAEFRFIDLDLDVLIYPDGRHLVLDEEEFADHSVRFGYPAAVIAAARQAVVALLGLAHENAPPFDGSLAAWHHTPR